MKRTRKYADSKLAKRVALLSNAIDRERNSVTWEEWVALDVRLMNACRVIVERAAKNLGTGEPRGTVIDAYNALPGRYRERVQPFYSVWCTARDLEVSCRDDYGVSASIVNAAKAEMDLRFGEFTLELRRAYEDVRSARELSKRRTISAIDKHIQRIVGKSTRIWRESLHRAECYRAEVLKLEAKKEIQDRIEFEARLKVELAQQRAREAFQQARERARAKLLERERMLELVNKWQADVRAAAHQH